MLGSVCYLNFFKKKMKTISKLFQNYFKTISKLQKLHETNYLKDNLFNDYGFKLSQNFQQTLSNKTNNIFAQMSEKQSLLQSDKLKFENILSSDIIQNDEDNPASIVTQIKQQLAEILNTLLVEKKEYQLRQQSLSKQRYQEKDEIIENLTSKVYLLTQQNHQLRFQFRRKEEIINDREQTHSRLLARLKSQEEKADSIIQYLEAKQVKRELRIKELENRMQSTGKIGSLKSDIQQSFITPVKNTRGAYLEQKDAFFSRKAMTSDTNHTGLKRSFTAISNSSSCGLGNTNVISQCANRKKGFQEQIYNSEGQFSLSLDKILHEDFESLDNMPIQF